MLYNASLILHHCVYPKTVTMSGIRTHDLQNQNYIALGANIEVTANTYIYVMYCAVFMKLLCTYVSKIESRLGSAWPVVTNMYVCMYVCTYICTIDWKKGQTFEGPQLHQLNRSENGGVSNISMYILKCMKYKTKYLKVI
jgi:hypothetical protein